MTAFKGGSTRSGVGAQRPYDDTPKWRRTPWWHPRRWFGYTWMRLAHRYTGHTLIYRTEQQRAREVLEEAYGQSSPTGSPGRRGRQPKI